MNYTTAKNVYAAARTLFYSISVTIADIAEHNIGKMTKQSCQILKTTNTVLEIKTLIEAGSYLGKPKPTILDLRTGKYKHLEEKAGSTNFFFEPIFKIINNVMYEIRLRIDPKDPHSKNIPVLDVQIWEIRDGQRIRELDKNKISHHNYRKPDGTYEWKYESIEEKFILYTKGAGLIFDMILAPPKPTGLIDVILAPPKTSGLTVSMSPTIDATPKPKTSLSTNNKTLKDNTDKKE